MYIKEKDICLADISKINSNCEKTNNAVDDSKRKKESWNDLAVKKTIYIINRNNIKSIMIVFFVWIVFILLENEINLNLMTKYVDINVFVELQCHQRRIIY